MVRERDVQRREPGSGARIPELDEIVLAAGNEQAHGRVPLDALDVPPVSGEDALFSALGEGPDPHGRVVAGRGETRVVRREAEPANGLAVCGPRGQVVHVGLEVLDDAGLVRRRDVGAGVVEGERADGGVVRLENGLKVEREAVPRCELPARRARQYAATLRCPLRVTLVKCGARYNRGTTNGDCVHWTSDFVRGRVDELCTERCRGIVRVGFWREKLHPALDDQQVCEYLVHTDHTHVNNIWRTWPDIWYISWIRLQLAKLFRGTNESETSQGKKRFSHQRPTAHPSCIVDCPPRTCLFQCFPIEQLTLNGKLEVLNALVVNDRWLRGLQMPLRFPLGIACRIVVLNREK